MKKLLTVCPIPNDATSFYRGVGPLSSLQNKGLVELMYHDKPDWTVMKHVDAVFVQRPHLPDYLHIIDIAKKYGKPIWVDYDDLLTRVSDCNPARYNYWRQDVQDTIKACLKNADIVTVSTQPLADAWKEFANKFIVVPNAWDDELYPKPKALPESDKPNMLWRGSGGHDEDLWSVTEGIANLANNQDYNWYFIGMPFWYTLRELQRHVEPKVAAWNDLPQYFKLLETLNPTVMLTPIVDNPFNRCKSNIAWIEGSWAGAVSVAPNWGEWVKPGIVNYGAGKSFEDAVKEAVDFSKSKSAESWAYIESELRLSKVNELREQVLRELKLLPPILSRVW